MTNAEHAADGDHAGGRGRLAQLIATRGGTAAPEAPFVIEHREALIYMLCEAAELEHGIMCQYLFAAFSLKQATGEGLTEAEAAAANHWRKQVLHVATQEMLHLALVQNLLTAIGGPPHLIRPNLPQPADHYPAGVQLALLPFGERALSHFMFLERPEGMDLADADGLAAVGRAEPLMSEGDIVPRSQDFATVGHLYRSIEAGFTHLTEKFGQDWLFVGPPRAQATAEHFRWPELVAVTDLASAQLAIDTILEQGEGPRGEWRNAHFGQFVEILDEYQQMREASPGFDPVRPVIAANVRPPQRDVEVPLITDPVTARVADLFNVGYEILLQVFERYFTHTEETDAQLKVLADATIQLMVAVLQPLADVITTLPAGPGHEGKTAGPSFELFYESDYLLPHREAAWTLLTERLDGAASFCGAVGGDCSPAVAGRLAPVRAALAGIARSLGEHLPAGRSHAGQAGLDPAVLAAALARADDLARQAGVTGWAGVTGEARVAGAADQAGLAGTADQAGAADQAAVAGTADQAAAADQAAVAGAADQAAVAGAARGTPGEGDDELAAGMTAVARAAYEAVTAAAAARPGTTGAGGGAGRPDLAVPRLVDSVLRPLADALRAPAAGGRLPGENAAQTSENATQTSENAAQPGDEASQIADGSAHADAGRAPAQLVWQVARTATTLRARAGQAGVAVPELAEATAALQALALELAPPRERDGLRAELWRLQGDLPAGIQAARNGPYLVTNVARLRNDLGEQIPVPPQVALCRCGESAVKPFCDGSHADNGFTDGKDPKRVPDRLDTYPGLRVTVRDNRGTCQHSGLCTDRLATVFRVGQEPFVAPSGARMDEIISAVRDCPSGALGLALDGRDERELTDWGDGREPAIEVTRDGPYRITGGISLQDPAGTGVARNAGASREHYALCRCGHSQNKPFCSGVHWYVGFRDPVPDPEREPTLFEWAGGLPALTRMTRALFDIYVPGDALLAPVFANLPPGHPERVAAWLGEVFGGPAADDGCPPRGADLTEEQRARWITQFGLAAQAAGLPDDAEFRAALGSFIEWESRADQSAKAPAPRWDWGPAGAPAFKIAVPDDEAGRPEVTLPAAGQPVGFAAHIKPLFRARDRDSMRFALDLWSYEDVKAHASGILERLRDGSMPCDGAWPGERVEVFERWTATQMRP
jgi:CDGSH-type Zn-finger protein/truncated hemoglobin YjbI